MIVLSHRGYWKSAEEKNQAAAFVRSFELGFGTETDVRDALNTLVISHDPPRGGEMMLEELLAIRGQYQGALPLALNIKADGLQTMLLAVLRKYDNYFLFDMSVPDSVGYANAGLKFFTRQSEFETIPALYEPAAGVWVDCFHSDWAMETEIARHLNRGKQVCLVSPDLHRRDPVMFWQRLASMECVRHPGLMLCTDRPEEAREVFTHAD